MIFEYKVRAKHRLGFKEFKLYATTDIEEFFNRNNIEYVRNMTDTVEHRLFNEIERLNNIIDKALELIYVNAYDTERKECIDDLWGSIEELVDILKGSDKE